MVQVEAQRYLDDLAAWRDAKIDEIGLLPRCDRDDACRDAREGSLDPEIHGALTLPEVTAKDRAVVRMHDGADPRDPGSDASEGACLGEMRMDDVRFERASEQDQARERAEVVQRGDHSAESGQDPRVDRRQAPELEHVAFVPALDAAHEKRLVSRRVEPRSEERDVNRGTADVQPGDHTHHADPLHDRTVLASRRNSTVRRRPVGKSTVAL